VRGWKGVEGGALGRCRRPAPSGSDRGVFEARVPQARYGATRQRVTTGCLAATRIEAMATSTLPLSFVGTRSGRSEEISLPGVVCPSPTPSSIRLAGLTDIPAIAHLTREGPQRAGIESAAMSRATRLFLANVAFEHGALWVEQVVDGPIIRAAAAVPAEQVLSHHSILQTAIRALAGPAVPPPVPVLGFGEVLRAELTSVKPVWLVIEFSKASQSRLGDPALLGAALEWTREHSEPMRDPVMVLTDTMSERRAAESLGFIERRAWGRRRPWWLGVAGPVAHAFSA